MYASYTTVQGSGTRRNKIRINGYCTEDPVTQLASILKMEGTRYSETPIAIYRTKGHYSPTTTVWTVTTVKTWNFVTARYLRHFTLKMTANEDQKLHLAWLNNCIYSLALQQSFSYTWVQAYCRNGKVIAKVITNKMPNAGIQNLHMHQQYLWWCPCYVKRLQHTCKRLLAHKSKMNVR
jgi:hypothetical protein